MKLEMPAFIEKYGALIPDEDERKPEFLEDIADSLTTASEPQKPDYESDDNPYKKKSQDAEARAKDLQKRYIERFMGGTPKEDDIRDEDHHVDDHEDKPHGVLLNNGVFVDTDVFKIEE